MVHLSKGKRKLKTDIVNWKLVPVPQEHVEIGRRSKTERDETRTLSSRYKGYPKKVLLTLHQNLHRYVNIDMIGVNLDR